jgi:S-adenosylmethionine-diacylglycerol 3-amino-3-carboxypropyl transferase
MDSSLSPWVVEAAKLPVAFAQVREDALLDLEVLGQLADGARVILVASGGCTAAALAAAGRASYLHLVDPNPTQIALTRLKLRLLQTAAPKQRLALLGHAPMPAANRRALLGVELQKLGLTPDGLGPMDLVAEVGPDHAGRYELTFVELRAALRPWGDEVTALLRLRDLAEQAERVAPGTRLGQALDQAFDSVMALPNLVRLFGEQATHNRVEPFARHFARRTRHVLATLPAADNPYLWQLLAGRFPEGTLSPWLTAPAPARLPEVSGSVTGMAEALRTAPNAFDLVHLSNILDWLTPAEASAALALAWEALRPGGCVLIRQLNSVLDIPSLGPRFDWQTGRAEALHARDRSFFYRALHLGRKR